jgi:Xaa-Pro aminopeptidase
MNRTRLNSLLERHGCAAVIVTTPENVFYLTGFQPFQEAWNRFGLVAVVVPLGDGAPALVLPGAQVGLAVDRGFEETCALYPFGGTTRIDDNVRLEDAEERIAGFLRDPYQSRAMAMRAAVDALDLGSGRVSVDQSATPDVVDQVERAGLGIERDADELLRLTRMVKTTAEISRLQRAVALNESAIQAALARLGTDTDAEVAEVFRATVGAQGGVVQHWLGSSGRYAGVIRDPGDHRARHGERFSYDAGVIVDGYCSDLGGTAQVGAEPSADERETYEALTAGIEAGLEAARPGLLVSDLYSTIIDAVREHGISDYRHHMVGHGIGVEPRDYPTIAAAAGTWPVFGDAPFDPELETGMVLNLETPLKKFGIGGFQHEVTCLVGDSHVKLLSPLRDYRVITPTAARPI